MENQINIDCKRTIILASSIQNLRRIKTCINNSTKQSIVNRVQMFQGPSIQKKSWSVIPITAESGKHVVIFRVTIKPINWERVTEMALKIYACLYL